MEKNKLLERFDSFASSLGKGLRIALIFHRDADGLASGFVVKKCVNSAGADVVFEQALEYDEFPEAAEKLLKMEFDRVIISDMSVDAFPEQVKALEKKAEILQISLLL